MSLQIISVSVISALISAKIIPAIPVPAIPAKVNTITGLVQGHLSLSSEFIKVVKLLFPIFGVFFDAPDPKQKFKNLAQQTLNDHGFGGFAKIWLKSVARIRRIFAEKIGETVRK